MKMFKDKSLKEPIDFISFGETEVGSSKIVEVYFYNNSEQKLKELKFLAGSEVQVLSAPVELLKESMAPVVFKWTPSVTLKKALNIQVEIQGVKVYEY